MCVWSRSYIVFALGVNLVDEHGDETTNNENKYRIEVDGDNIYVIYGSKPSISSSESNLKPDIPTLSTNHIPTLVQAPEIKTYRANFGEEESSVDQGNYLIKNMAEMLDRLNWLLSNHPCTWLPSSSFLHEKFNIRFSAKPFITRLKKFSPRPRGKSVIGKIF